MKESCPTDNPPHHTAPAVAIVDLLRYTQTALAHARVRRATKAKRTGACACEVDRTNNSALYVSDPEACCCTTYILVYYIAPDWRGNRFLAPKSCMYTTYTIFDPGSRFAWLLGWLDWLAA